MLFKCNNYSVGLRLSAYVHLRTFEIVRVQICRKNSNLSISHSKFPDKKPQILNTNLPPPKNILLLPTPTPHSIIDLGTMTSSAPGPWGQESIIVFLREK